MEQIEFVKTALMTSRIGLGTLAMGDGRWATGCGAALTKLSRSPPFTPPSIVE